jgi:hypothetical protein
MSVTERILSALASVIRLETVLELALHRSSGASGRLLQADGDPTDA